MAHTPAAEGPKAVTAAAQAPASVGTAILVHIRASLPTLRPAERRVADAVLADPAGVSSTSISALARQCDTSETTVIRFCRAIGLQHYPELRLALARAASWQEAEHGRGPHLSSDISPTDSVEEIISKITFSDARAIEETGSTLDSRVLEKAIDAVARSHRIDIYGVGASGFVGMDLHQKLHRIGLLAFVWTDSHAALTSAALLNNKDVAIAISHTGATVDTIDALRTASEHGATTVAITNFASSPLAELADHVLTTAARETTFRSGAMASRIAQLAVIDCLFVGVAQRFYDTAMTALEDTYAAMRGRRLN